MPTKAELYAQMADKVTTQLTEGRMEFGRGGYHQHTVGATAVVHVRPSFRGR